jgi:hypothetical protein
VESSAVAWNLWLARNALWDPLGSAERRNVLAWFAAAATIQPFDNNWRLFSVVVLTVLKLLGGLHDRTAIEYHLNRIDSFYVGDGWYSDGVPEGTRSLHLDYYNAWVIHSYLLMWCMMDGDSDGERKSRIIERARTFLETYPFWFGASGSFPCFGRSMIYRTAVTGIFGWAVATGACPQPVGLARRLCGLVLRRMLETPGVVGPEGQLSMGLAREFPPMVEDYSGLGSPYWAGKAFSVLIFPPEHPFWAEPEEPLPIERASYVVSLPHAGFLLQGSCDTGEVQVRSTRT